MRTFYAFGLSALCLTSVSMHGQEVMLDDFEDVRQLTYGLDIPFPDQLQNGIGGTEWPGWHGTLLQYQVNPGANGVNSSAMCAEYTRNPSEVYDVILMNPGLLADVAPFTDGTSKFQMDVFAPVPGITIQFTLQNAALALGGYPQGRHSEYVATTTTGGQWETLTFNLSNEPWANAANTAFWPDENTANNAVDQIVLLFNPGVNISETYYFDNLVGPAPAVENCDAFNADANILMNADCENDGWSIEYFDGRMSIFPNPAVGGSGKAVEYARNGGAADDVIVGNFGGALNLPASAISATMSLDIYDSNAPSTVVVSLQDASGAELALYTLNTSTSNQWETLLMDLNPLLGFPNVTDFVILIEPGQLVAETFYLDNFQYETTVGLEEQALQAFTCYPNPGENVRLSWASSAVAPEFVRIFDASGRLVQELSTKGLQQIEVVGLESGVYFAHAEGFGTYRFVISSNAR